nr:MAG TPA: hypothetical protein [Crassvirales sp.]
MVVSTRVFISKYHLNIIGLKVLCCVTWSKSKSKSWERV